MHGGAGPASPHWWQLPETAPPAAANANGDAQLQARFLAAQRVLQEYAQRCKEAERELQLIEEERTALELQMSQCSAEVAERQQELAQLTATA
jgi:chromosome segregation ATPase